MGNGWLENKTFKYFGELIRDQIKRNIRLTMLKKNIAYVYLDLLLVAYEYTHIKLHKKP